MLEGFLKPNPQKLLEMASQYDPAPLEQMLNSFSPMPVPGAQGQDMSNPWLQFMQPTIPAPQPNQATGAPLDAKALALLGGMQPRPVAPHWAPPASLPNMTRNIQFAALQPGQAPSPQLPNFAAILQGVRR